MSFNGSGTFSINTAGQPVVTGSTITSTAFNALTADLATGLSTALCKDGQSTPTANIGMGAFKITNLGAGTLATDAARVGQVQAGAASYLTVTGTDTVIGTASPSLTAYAAGNAFSFVAAGTNTGAATLNIDGLGAKSITRNGTTALGAGDIVSGQVVYVVYDGTRFQVTNANAFNALSVSTSLAVGGVAVVTTARTVSVSGTGLSGGGDLSANRTITIDQTAMKCKNLSSGGTGTAMTAQSGGTASGGSDGDIILIY